jgi:hypothetical protein
MIAFDEDLSRSGTKVREELVVVMPHRAAKILAHTLGSVIANHEANYGPISFPEERLREIEAAVKEQAARVQPPEKKWKRPPQLAALFFKPAIFINAAICARESIAVIEAVSLFVSEHPSPNDDGKADRSRQDDATVHFRPHAN